MNDEIKAMVKTFRVTELQSLLGFAGKSKTGRKNELQVRALQLVDGNSLRIVEKIKELYNCTRVQQLYPGLSPTTAATLLSSNVGSSSSTFGNPFFGPSDAVFPGADQCLFVPICPDIRMKELPFYDIVANLLRPTSLVIQGQGSVQQAEHSFYLSPSQAQEITNSQQVAPTYGPMNNTKVHYQTQVQLRFCSLDSTQEQKDLFPQGLVVKVNGRLVQLPPISSSGIRPGAEPKRPSKPLDITSNVKCSSFSSNVIHVTWQTTPQQQNRSYCMLINMVKKLSADDLFARLKAKRIHPSDFTRGRIKEITAVEENDLCAPTSIVVSVACPLGKRRMQYPCRATRCTHLQCFDAYLFLLMNERRPNFMCPVCNEQLKFGDLCIDGYFLDILQNLSIDAGNEIELLPDGSWLAPVKVETPLEKINCSSDEPSVAPIESCGGVVNKAVDPDDDVVVIEDATIKPVQPQVDSPAGANPEPEVVDLMDSSD